MGSFFSAFKAIFWAFLGVRKSKDRERDFANLNIVHIVIAGLIGAALFVALLMIIVHSVIATDHP